MENPETVTGQEHLIEFWQELIWSYQNNTSNIND